MAELATLARPYANAVFSLARETAALDRWARCLGLLAAATGEELVGTLLAAPEVPAEQKAFHLADVCGEEVDEQARRFLLVLARNGRLPLLGEICSRFEELKGGGTAEPGRGGALHLPADRNPGGTPEGCVAQEVRQGSAALQRSGPEPSRRRRGSCRRHGHRRFGAWQARQAGRVAGPDVGGHRENAVDASEPAGSPAGPASLRLEDQEARTCNN